MPARSLPRALRAPVLLLVLALTTGWMDVGGGRPRLSDASDARKPVARALGAGFSTIIARAEHAQQPAMAQEAPVQAAPVQAAPVQPAPVQAAPVQAAPVPVESTAAPALVDGARTDSSSRTYPGANRFRIPALGIKGAVRPFACSRQNSPGNHIYRWGCAGGNNIYIMGHAHSVMKALHEAYVRGELRVGMVAAYANRKGVVTRYSVTEWRVLDPADSSWAIAAQPVPSMTIQTCVGVDGQDRLVIRLVAVG